MRLRTLRRNVVDWGGYSRAAWPAPASPGGSRPAHPEISEGLSWRFRTFRTFRSLRDGKSGLPGPQNGVSRSIFRCFSRFSTALVLEQFESLQNWPTLTKHRNLRCFRGFRRLCEHTKNRQKSTTNRSDNASRAHRVKKLDFFAPRRDLASILVASARSGTLPGVLLGVPGCPS